MLKLNNSIINKTIVNVYLKIYIISHQVSINNLFSDLLSCLKSKIKIY